VAPHHGPDFSTMIRTDSERKMRIGFEGVFHRETHSFVRPRP